MRRAWRETLRRMNQGIADFEHAESACVGHANSSPPSRDTRGGFRYPRLLGYLPYPTGPGLPVLLMNGFPESLEIGSRSNGKRVRDSGDRTRIRDMAGTFWPRTSTGRRGARACCNGHAGGTTRSATASNGICRGLVNHIKSTGRTDYRPHHSWGTWRSTSTSRGSRRRNLCYLHSPSILYPPPNR